jgi:endonuclease/exonuclease/phosphatase family metal-dependent hydrolase
VGADGRFDPHRTAHVLGELKADLVALQEVDRRFGRRTGLLDTAMLEHATGLTLLPVSPLPDGHGWHGNALLLRPGIARVLDIRRIALPGAEPRGAIIVDLAPKEGGVLRVVAAHLGLLRRSRRQQVASLVEAITEGGEAPPSLLLGDLNEWRLAPAPGCSLRGLEPVFGHPPRFPESFPARLPVLALDRILGTPRGLLGPVSAHHSPLARIASDHLPLVATLRLAATRAALPAAARAA